MCVERVDSKQPKPTKEKEANANLEPTIDSHSNHKYSKTHRKLL